MAIFLTALLLFAGAAATDDGWNPVPQPQGTKVNFDWESKALQIKTNNADDVKVTFYEDNEQKGKVFLRNLDTDSPEVNIYNCYPEWNVLNKCSSDGEIVWTFSKKLEGQVPRITVQCDDKTVVNIIISDTACSDRNWGKWIDVVTKFKITSAKAISYRSKPVQCKALTVGNALVSPSGPVQVNSVAKVTCMSDHLHYLISVTCEAGETWSSTPTCQNMGSPGDAK